MHAELLNYRHEFPILKEKTYLVSNSLGAMPQVVYSRMQDYAETWAKRGVSAWEEIWWDLPAQTGNVIAPLIGAGDGELSIHPNVTSIHGIIYSCFNDPALRRNRTKIIAEELHFPSVLYITDKWARRNGCTVRLVKSRDTIGVETEDMIDAIDERTLFVVMSHVLFRSAYIQDAEAIVRHAHSVGALVILDVYQSTGIIPFDVKRLDVDIVAGGVLKWLCGGPGTCFMYVKPGLSATLEPEFTGWFAHDNPFEFDTGNFKPAAASKRFLNGTPPIPALYAAAEGPALLRKAGIPKIRERSLHLTGIVIDKALEYGFTVHTPIDRTKRGGTVTVSVPHGFEVSRELIARGILVDYRKQAGIRIAPHFYNTEEEAAYAVEQIREIIDTKSYVKHTGSKPTVT